MGIKIGWIIVAALVCLLVFIVVGNITREAALRKAIKRSEKWEREQREQNDAAATSPNARTKSN